MDQSAQQDNYLQPDPYASSQGEVDFQESSNVPPPQIPHSSPLKKILPLVVIVVFIIVILSLLVLLKGRATEGEESVTPTGRPTATPFIPPTIPMVTEAPTASISGSITPEPTARKIEDLLFIRNGDIYHSDFSVFSLLAENQIPAGDKLSLSPDGNYLAWRPASGEAIPSALVYYSINDDVSYTIEPVNASNVEVIDFDWSDDSESLAVLYKNDDYYVSRFLFSSISEKEDLYSQTEPITQIFWPQENAIIMVTEKGIILLELDNLDTSTLVQSTDIVHASLSPQKDKILYSVGDRESSDLYLMSLDGSENVKIEAKPQNIDMQSTGLTETALDKGFIPFALFFPQGNRLLVGYHYLQYIPLVGIYDFEEGSFSAISPFTLYSSDIIVDENRLIGARINTTGNSPNWQVAVYRIEENGPFSTTRVIPSAYSPVYNFSKDAQGTKLN